MKKIIIRILHLIRRILTALKRHCLPLPSPHYSPYMNYTREQTKKSFDHFKQYFQTSVIINTEDIHEYAIKKANENNKEEKKFNLEFGVWKGKSINTLSKFTKKIYGFDAFEGLKEDWLGTATLKGAFNLNGVMPKLNKNVVPIKGWVQDTLVLFLNENKPQINFVHMDLDTYESTRFVLEKIKPYLIKNCIILFDELYNYCGWEVGEYKALKETFNENEYKFILFSTENEQAAIQII